MVPFDRFTAVLDACVLYPMLTRDILLTLAAHEFFSPKWSPRIRQEWTGNLAEERLKKHLPVDVQAKVMQTAAVMDRIFPDALVCDQPSESEVITPVDPKDRHVAMTAIVARADAIVTFNKNDFAPAHLLEKAKIEVIHPDDFVMNLIDLNEKRATAAFRELRARKKSQPWERQELIDRTRASGMVQTALWLATEDVSALI